MAIKIIKNLKLDGNPDIYQLGNSGPDATGKIQIFNNQIAYSYNFSQDSGNKIYPWKGYISNYNITSDMCPSVNFSLQDASSGIFAPVADSYDGGIYIYATEQPNSNITIPNIICWKNI